MVGGQADPQRKALLGAGKWNTQKKEMIKAALCGGRGPATAL